MSVRFSIGLNEGPPETPRALRSKHFFQRQLRLIISAWVGALTLACAEEGTAQNYDCPNPVDCLLPSEALACWLQHPDTTTNGFDVLATWGTNPPCSGNPPQIDSPIMADDFVACCEYLPNIYIWGSWLDDAFDSNATMMVSIWEDQPSMNGLCSQPLSALGPIWSGYFGPSNNPALECLPYMGNYAWCLAAANLQERFLDPTMTNVLGYDTNLYCYEFPIPYYEPVLNPGEVYWLSVSALTKSLTNLFGWKCCITNDHHLDDSVFTNGAYAEDDANPPWIDLHYPPCSPFASNSMDLSFALASEEVDYFSNSLVTIKFVLEAPGAAPMFAYLTGSATVVVAVGPNGQTCYSTNGLDAAITEMVQLDVSGPCGLGTMSVSLQCPDDCGNAHSLGLIYEETNLIPGTLEVPPFAPGLANSSFNIFETVKIITDSTILEWCATQPTLMNAVINNKPPGVAGAVVGGLGTGAGGLPGSVTVHANRYNALQLVRLLPKLFGSKLLMLIAMHDPHPPTGVPIITIDPESVYAPTFGMAQFSVAAAVVLPNGSLVTGTSLSYQWYQAISSNPTQFTLISHATNETYTVPTSEVSPSFSGSAFQVVVRYSGSSLAATSAPAYLNVEGPLQYPNDLDPNVFYVPTAGVVLLFTTESNHTYSVLSADDPSWTQWFPAYSLVPAVPYSGPVTVPIVPTETAQFFRIVSPAVGQ